jgi:hypothetical protein
MLGKELKLVTPVNVELPKVVEASVEEPVTNKFPVVVSPVVFVVVALVVEALRVVK